jgi:N6-adenosine-specific RNA methylase IME4
MPDKLVRLVNEGLTFDVIFIGGCLDYEVDGRALSMLPIGQITPRPSVLFLWVSNPMLEQGRQALENWGFRRSEDIVYFTMSQNSLHFPKGLASDPNDCVIKTTWHCLLGLKGTLRRSEDFDLINCNVDTDVIMQSPAERPNIVPEAIYEIIENFCLMSRRVHIIPGRAAISKPVRARPGWVIMSPDILLDNLDSASAYFQASLNPSHRIPVDAEIDALRPRTPPRHDHSFSK